MNNLTMWATQEGAGGRLPTVLKNIAAALAQGNVLGAFQEISFGITGAATSLFGLVDLLAIPYSVSKNVTAVLYTIVPKGLFDTGLIGKTAYGILNVASVGITAVGRSVQAVIDSAKTGDATGAVSAAVNAPADIFDWVVNGGPPNRFGNRGPGLLYNREGAYFGPVAALVLRIPKAIAAAITPAEAPVTTTADPLAITTTPGPDLPAADSPATAAAAGPAPDSAPITAASALDDSQEPRVGVEPDTTAAVSVSAPETSGISAENTAKPGKAESRSTQQVKASLWEAADHVDKRAKKLGAGLEKTVKKVSDGLSKAGKKKQRATGSASPEKKAKAAGDD
ncbi:hypothetical protein A5719_09935 [Mycolicibacterium peregrinum]|nr:hypothetical protein A5719_09935 [Mycolicibacterium peregrinum]